MELISREELKAKLDRGDNFKLVMAMDERHFRAGHIPGSLRCTNAEEAKGILEFSDEIVIYCSDAPCTASQLAYRVLHEHGYLNIRRYAGGVRDWADAGYTLIEGDA